MKCYKQLHSWSLTDLKVVPSKVIIHFSYRHVLQPDSYQMDRLNEGCY